MKYLGPSETLRYVADKADSYRKLSIALGKYPTYISSSINDGRSPTLSTLVRACSQVGVRVAIINENDEVEAIIKP